LLLALSRFALSRFALSRFALLNAALFRSVAFGIAEGLGAGGTTKHQQQSCREGGQKRVRIVSSD
jgi:hypothetical protein